MYTVKLSDYINYAEKIKVQYSNNKKIKSLKDWVENHKISNNISYLFTDTSKNSRNPRFKCDGYIVYTLNLFPAITIEKIDNKLLNIKMNTCASCGYCKDICIGLNGPKEMVSQLKKTLLVFKNPEIIKKEIEKIIKKNKLDKIIFRLNNYSDIAWEEIKLKNLKEKNIFEEFSKVTFYDYTKIKSRFIKYIKGEMPSNYFLTYSYDKKKKNKKDFNTIIRALNYSYNKIKKPISIAFIINNKQDFSYFIYKLKTNYKNINIIDGDKCDIRVLDSDIKNNTSINIVLLKYNESTGLNKDKNNKNKYFLTTIELKKYLNRLNKIALKIEVNK